MKKAATLIGRILLRHIFLLAGISKMGGCAATQGWMEAMGVSGALLPLMIALEIGAGFALILGFQARLTALGLAGFSIISAVIFHANLSDQVQSIMFMKNFSIAGGLFYVAALGAGEWSIDSWIKQKGSDKPVKVATA
ncbi:MAG: DoxX family protein [Thiotrichaceae bacterium]|nr:DoxX family protein [Thiotrichaceae bacterium]MBL1262026.1 DoxX family protein [Thiotrichaceae bacterium]PCI13238.1 MAG: DoxX family protein [Thiotrichales bacterium]